jgi:hypothetical protein
MINLRQQDVPRRMLVVLMFALALAVSGFVAFCANFSQFKAYDDEGYVMRSVQSYLDGHVLYDEVYTQYGPVYFIWKSFWHKLTGWPVSHDMVRTTTLIMWLGSTLLASLASFRMTKSMPLASAVYLLTFFVVGNFSNESGHPQEFCALLLAALTFTATFVTPSTKSRGAFACIGALVAALVLTKINVGVYAGLALTGTLLSFAHSGKLRLAASLALFCIAALFPFALMRAHLADNYAQNYIAVTTLSIVAALGVTLFGIRSGTISLKTIAIAAGTFLFVTAGILLIVFTNGTSFDGFLQGILGQHLKFVGEFYHPPKFARPALFLALISCVAAVGYCVCQRTRIRFPTRFEGAVKLAANLVPPLFIACVCGAAWFGDALTLLGFAVPWLWLVLAVPARDELAVKQLFFRRFVALLVTFEVLQGHPIAGTQLSIATFPVVALAALCAHDWWRKLQPNKRFASQGFVLTSKLLTYGVVLAIWCVVGVQKFDAYKGFTPLGLPGANWIRLKATQAAEIRCVAANLRERCDTFFSSPGLNSFYFWAEREPPTHLNATVWTGLFDDAKQNCIIEELERHPNAMFVRQQRLDSIPRTNLDNQPLVKYLRARYKTYTQIGEYQIFSDAERRLPPLVEAATVVARPVRVASLPMVDVVAPVGKPGPMFQISLAKSTHPQAPIARVQIIDGRNDHVFADSRRGGKLGLQLFDAALSPLELPLPANWIAGEVGTLNVAPSEDWHPPQTLPRALVRLLDKHGNVIATIPFAKSSTELESL